MLKSLYRFSLVVYGVSNLYSCLRNVVTMFYIIEKERRWRQSQGLPRGFESLDRHKPIVAVGPRRPLEEQQTMADYFRMSQWLPIEEKRY